MAKLRHRPQRRDQIGKATHQGEGSREISSLPHFLPELRALPLEKIAWLRPPIASRRIALVVAIVLTPVSNLFRLVGV